MTEHKPEDDVLQRVIIDIEIVEDKLYTFADGGEIRHFCPGCDVPIIINLKGLKKSPHLTPSLTIRNVNLNKRMLSILG